VLSQQVFFVSSWLVCQNMATISSNSKHFHNALSKTWFCVITGTENAHVAYLSAALADEKVYLPATLTASVCRSALFLFSCSI
jgi:Ca2+/Na+ antiporter